MKKVYHAMLMRGGILIGDVNNYTLAAVATPLSLLAIVYGSGGIPKANWTIRTPTPFYYYVMRWQQWLQPVSFQTGLTTISRRNRY